jgi:hypothetical protein
LERYGPGEIPGNLRRLAIFDERFVPAGLADAPAGATQDEVADVLLAIAPMAGLGRVVSAAPNLAAALGYDVVAALEELDDHGSLSCSICRHHPDRLTAALHWPRSPRPEHPGYAGRRVLVSRKWSGDLRQSQLTIR